MTSETTPFLKTTASEPVDVALDDGLTLRGVAWRPAANADEAASLPIICLHGLTRNVRDFSALGPRLAARGREVLALSFRGRGQSDYADDYLTYHPRQYADDIENALRILGITRAIFIGTSLGGIVTMLLAARAPHLIGGAVLNDIGPDLAPEGLQRIGAYMAARNQRDGSDGATDGGFAPVAFDAAVAATRAINADAFPARPPSFWPAMMQRCYRETPQGWQLDYDPAIARALGEVGPAPDLWVPFRALADTAPLLVIRGALSDLLTPPIVARMHTAAPTMTAIDVPDTGHAPMLDEPAATAAIDRFLASVD